MTSWRPRARTCGPSPWRRGGGASGEWAAGGAPPGGRDGRTQPLGSGREHLEKLVAGVNAPGRLLLSPTVTAASWEDLARQRLESRDRSVEGLMLKRRSSPYRVGRQRGDWWKWKV